MKILMESGSKETLKKLQLKAIQDRALNGFLKLKIRICYLFTSGLTTPSAAKLNSLL